MDRLESAPKYPEPKQMEADAAPCCDTSELATCCERSAKSGCCGPQAENSEKAPVSCGCR